MAHRLDSSWLAIDYPDRGKKIYRKKIPMEALLQKDYGKARDCTLTSLASIFGKEYYSYIEKIAEKYGYEGDKKGTNPLTVRNIMREFMKQFDVPGTPKSAYGKGVGWTWKGIKKLISADIPVILNLWDDGRKYYHDHSVTVVGIEEYKNARFLIVLDNWSKKPAFVDYGKLCMISSLNWIEK